MVSTLQLGFCMTLYVEGRPVPESHLPLWLIHLFAICNAGAFLQLGPRLIALLPLPGTTY